MEIVVNTASEMEDLLMIYNNSTISMLTTWFHSIAWLYYTNSIPLKNVGLDNLIENACALNIL